MLSGAWSLHAWWRASAWEFGRFDFCQGRLSVSVVEFSVAASGFNRNLRFAHGVWSEREFHCQTFNLFLASSFLVFSIFSFGKNILQLQLYNSLLFPFCPTSGFISYSLLCSGLSWKVAKFAYAETISGSMHFLAYSSVKIRAKFYGMFAKLSSKRAILLAELIWP